MIQTHKIIFTDIDGTLIDIYTGEYGQNIELIQKYKELSIPIILCSAKTWAEQEKIRQDVDLITEPFIVENGGAIVIPRNYFDFSIKGAQEIEGYMVIELGRPAQEIREKLDMIKRHFKIQFTSVGDVSIEELARIATMSVENAKRMSQRRYGETVLEIEKKDMAEFTQIANRLGLNIIHGGRFFDVTIGNDKGKAVSILIELLRKKYGNKITFYGIGDSTNDYPMLKLMDIPILVQRPDESWADLDIKITRILGVGPEGWKNTFRKIAGVEPTKEV